MSSWRRATAPPFGPDGTFYPNMIGDGHPATGGGLHRRRLDAALINQTQVYDQRGGHHTTPRGAPPIMTIQQQQLSGRSPAACGTTASTNYEVVVSGRSSGGGGGGVTAAQDAQVTLSAVAGAIDSARRERDAYKASALMNELESIQLRRHASEAANTALSSHRQTMFTDNALRSAEAQIVDLQNQLQAQMNRNDDELMKYATHAESREQHFANRLEAERSTITALEEALAAKTKELEACQCSLLEERKRCETLETIAREKEVMAADADSRVHSVGLAKAELSSFYDRTVRDFQEQIAALEKKHKEQIVAMQAEHSMQKIRLEEALTRSGIGEDSSRQALQVINSRLSSLCAGFANSSSQREHQAMVLGDALDELRAASASALATLSDEQHDYHRNVGLELGQGSELRNQVRKLQTALEGLTEDRSALQNRAETLTRELYDAQSELRDLRPAPGSAAAREKLARDVSDQAIDSALKERASVSPQRHHHSSVTPAAGSHSNPRFTPRAPNSNGGSAASTHHNQQQLVSPRAGSIAARLSVKAVRGLTAHPDLASRAVKISVLVFGSLGQQLCDVDCDEAPIDVGPAQVFASKSMHFDKDGRMPVTAYLHSADPGVLVVHVWGRVVGDSTIPRQFLGCAKLSVTDVMKRGPGTRVLALHDREPHESDVFIRSAAQGPPGSLGYVTVDVVGPFAAAENAPPLQNEALEGMLTSSGRGVVTSKRVSPPRFDAYGNEAGHQHGGGASSLSSGTAAAASSPSLRMPTNIPALPLYPQNSNSAQRQQHTATTTTSSSPLSAASSSAASSSIPLGEIWVRSCSWVKNIPQDARLYVRLTNQINGTRIMTTPKMIFDGDDGSSFWPKADSTVSLALSKDACFLMELLLAVSPIHGSGPLSSRDAVLGSALLTPSFLLGETVRKPDARQFGGAHSDRFAVSVPMEAQSAVDKLNGSAAVIELVVRIVG